MQIYIQEVWSGTRVSAFLTSSQVWGQSELQDLRAQSPLKTGAYQDHDVIDVSLSQTVTWDLVHVKAKGQLHHSSSIVLLCVLPSTCA